MSATPNVILLQSSSPERIFARSVSPCTPGKLFGFSPRSSSPPSMLSPSKLFGAPSPSRRHSAWETQKSPLGEEVGRENIPVVNNQQDSEAGGKVKRAPRKAPAKQQKLTGETELVSKDPQSKTAKRTTAATKKAHSQKSKKSEEAGNKILKGRVAKADGGKAIEVAEKTITSDNIQLDLSAAGARKPSVFEPEGLNFEEALKRRLDWTPPKNTECEVIDLDGGDDTASTKDGYGSRGFGDRLLDYRFKDKSGISQDHVQKIGDGHPTKRRRIELSEFQVLREPKKLNSQLRTSKAVMATDSVDVSAAQHRNEKPKSQRKKKKTITAHATARYIPIDEEKDRTLIRYFERDEEQTTDEASKAPKRKAPAKKCNNGVVKSNAPERIILSPEAATRSLANQEILFGTCSQLEGDDSPTFVRETQKALLASESFMSTESSNLSGQSAASARSKVSRFASSRGLWSVAARDSDGFVIQPEIVDMVDSPDVSSARQTISHQANPARVDRPRETKDDSLEIDANSNVQSKPDSIRQQNQEQPVAGRELSVPPKLAKPVNHREATGGVKEPSVPPPEMPRYSGFTDAELSKQIASYGFKPVKGRNKMIALLEKCWKSMHPTAEKVQEEESCESSSHGLEQTKKAKTKPSDSTKSADKAIVTVGSQAKASSRQADKGEQQQSDKPISRGRSKKAQTASSFSSVSGRSKRRKKAAPETEDLKATTTATALPSAAIVVEEIEDSEEELIPSPTRIQQQQQSRYFSSNTRRRRRRRRSPTTPALSPLPLSSSPGPSPGNTPKKGSTTTSTTTIHNTRHNDNDGDDGDDDQLPNLFAQITEAIRAQPRMPSGGPGQKRRPTWHEKILLYDPIVVEDLATWLNTEGLGLIGEDREVSAGLVREWCESKGICCCHRNK